MPGGAPFGRRLYLTLIGPEFTDAALSNIADACKARNDYVLGVVVNLHQIRLAAALLQATDIAVIGAVAYPLGNLPTELKVMHVREAIKHGAHGVAVVMKAEALRAGHYAEARQDAKAALVAGRQGGLSLGLIANCTNLSSAQAVEAAQIALDEGAAYVTNTGFGVESGPEHVRAVREGIGDELRIIAAGGCRTAEQAIEYVKAGADAAATSAALQIIEQLEALRMLREAV